MKKIIMPAMALVVLLPCLAGTLGLQVDLTGWWTNLEDNNHMIKIEQHGSDVAISGTNQPVVNGTFINDTLWVFLTDPAPDTVVLVYANDTLRGLSEEGHPLTVVSYVVDLSGWCKDLKSVDVLKKHQKSSDVSS